MSGRTGHGDVIVRADVAGTALFVVTASFAAIVFSTTAQWIGAITAIVLFAIGVVAFLWAFYNAVQRSRAEQISVTQLFLLFGDPTPSRVRRTMSAMLAIQVVTAFVTAFARPSTADGSPGSSLAVGILVPMFGLGMNGLWAAFHGDFPLREDDDAVAARAKVVDQGEEVPSTAGSGQSDSARGVRPTGGPIDQNGDHG